MALSARLPTVNLRDRPIRPCWLHLPRVIVPGSVEFLQSSGAARDPPGASGDPLGASGDPLGASGDPPGASGDPAGRVGGPAGRVGGPAGRVGAGRSEKT